MFSYILGEEIGQQKIQINWIHLGGSVMTFPALKKKGEKANGT